MRIYLSSSMFSLLHNMTSYWCSSNWYCPSCTWCSLPLHNTKSCRSPCTVSNSLLPIQQDKLLVLLVLFLIGTAPPTYMHACMHVHACPCLPSLAYSYSLTARKATTAERRAVHTRIGASHGEYSTYKSSITIVRLVKANIITHAYLPLRDRVLSRRLMPPKSRVTHVTLFTACTYVCTCKTLLES